MPPASNNMWEDINANKTQPISVTTQDFSVKTEL